MPRKPRIPGYCTDKNTGRAYVRLDRRFIRLPGEYGSEESRAEYDRLVTEWLAVLVSEAFEDAVLGVPLLAVDGFVLLEDLVDDPEVGPDLAFGPGLAQPVGLSPGWPCR